MATAPDNASNEIPEVQVDERLLAQVQDVVSSLTKTSKVYRTYPRENTISISAVNAMTKVFTEYLDKNGELELFVNRHELQWQGQPVYSEADPRKSFALKLDRDGVRRLVFYPSITRDELVGLLEVMGKDIDENSLDDDLITLLWEKHLEHVRAFVLDDFASGQEGFDEGLVGAGEMKGADVVEDAPTQGTSMGSRASSNQAVAPTTTAPAAWGATDDAGLATLCTATKARLAPLSDEQNVLLQNMIHNEETHDVSQDLTGILFDILRGETDRDGCLTACKVLVSVVIMHVKSLAFDAAADTLGTMRALAADEKLGKDVRATLVEQIQSMADQGHMTTVIDTLKEHEGLPAPAVQRFLTMLPASAADRLCDLSTVERYSAIAAAAISFLVKDDPKVMIPRLSAKNIGMAMGALDVLERAADLSVVQAMADVLRTAEDPVKIASVRMLTKVKGPAALDILFTFTASANTELRRTALKALAGFADKPAVALILRGEALDEGFDGRSFEEKKTFFTTLARLEGRFGVEFLDGILSRKKWFEKQHHAETRACAALALGEIDEDSARAALERNASEKSETVAAAVRHAISRLHKTVTAGR